MNNLPPVRGKVRKLDIVTRGETRNGRLHKVSQVFAARATITPPAAGRPPPWSAAPLVPLYSDSLSIKA